MWNEAWGSWYTIVLIRVKYLILIEKDYSDAECLVRVDRETQIEENDVLIRDTSVDMQATRTNPVKTKAASAPPLGTVLGTVTLPTNRADDGGKDGRGVVHGGGGK